MYKINSKKKKKMEEQTWIGFAGAIIGAILGGLVTFLSTHQAYKNNINLEKQKEKLIERSVVLSISEELQSLICSYQEKWISYIKIFQIMNF